MPIPAPIEIPLAPGIVAPLTAMQTPALAPTVQAPQVPAPVVTPQNLVSPGAPGQQGILRYWEGWSAAGTAAQNPVGPTANPDLISEIKLILAPVDQPVAPGQVQLQTFDGRLSANAMTLNTNNNAFSFVLTGVQERTLRFEGAHGDSFSYRCPDCSFLVWESGVGSPTASQASGIVFQLSSDERTLTATCRASECLAVGRSGDVRRAADGQIVSLIGSIVAAGFGNSETLTFPVLRGSGGGFTSCFNFGGGKPDGTPFTDADCSTNNANVGPARNIMFSVKR